MRRTWKKLAMALLSTSLLFVSLAFAQPDDKRPGARSEGGDLLPLQRDVQQWLDIYAMRTGDGATGLSGDKLEQWKRSPKVTGRLEYFLARTRQMSQAKVEKLRDIAEGLGMNVDSMLVNSAESRAQLFLDGYHERWLALREAAVEADWKANTWIVPDDTTVAAAATRAEGELAAFTGSEQNIKAAQKWLKATDRISPLQRRQFEVILYKAASHPATAKKLVSRRIKAETAQVQDLYGYSFLLDDGQEVAVAAIDSVLKKSTDLDERLRYWRASKEIGVWLKGGLTDLIYLRNASVQELGYQDFFQYMVSEYGISVEELLEMTERFNRELRPLYRELHTWARYELAERYGQPVPKQLPAHWLPNRWGQDLASMITVEGIDLDAALEDREPEFLIEASEDFYVSLGLPELPESFWSRSSLYPLPPGADHKKNNHASAWHVDLENDVRCLMSVTPTAEYWETTHHELGHIYYYIAYSNPDVPHLLRRGANRAFHEAVGSLLGLASMHQPFLVEREVIDGGVEVDEIQALMREAMNTVWFIPWSAGVMTRYEQELYGGPLSIRKMNSRWWELKERYQGIVPPGPRPAYYADGFSKTHISNDPAGYYDYALAYILLYQLHMHMATEVLGQDPHATNFFGKAAAGEFLKSILEPGMTRDWRALLDEAIGEQISARAMLDYFAPLHEWLKEQNQGREHTLPQL